MIVSASHGQPGRTGTALLVVFCLLALLVAGHPAAAAETQPSSLGTVARCFDGDTLRLADKRVVRLAGIDSPEMEYVKGKAQYYAREARDLLTRLALRQQVQLLSAGSARRDSHGRVLADVLLPDGRSLSDIMVSSGAAFFYPHHDLDPQLQERLHKLQQEAIATRQGMWAHVLAQPLAEKTYLGNRQSLRFFPANCAEAQRLKPRNRVYFGTLMDAFMAGYAPARVCPVWPTAK